VAFEVTIVLFGEAANCSNACLMDAVVDAGEDKELGEALLPELDDEEEDELADVDEGESFKVDGAVSTLDGVG